MKRLTSARPSRAVVIAFVALFVALTGTAVADKVIDGGDVRNNSLTGKDIKNFSLLKKDFKRGQLPGGPQGPQGAPGPAGRAGRDGFGRLEYEYAESVPLAVDDAGFLVAECPAGTYPTGGDVAALDAGENFLPAGVVSAHGFSIGVDGRPDGWIAFVDNQSGQADVVVYVDAICANASPPAPFLAARAKGAGLRPQGVDLER